MLVALIALKFAVLWALARSFGIRAKVGAAVAMLLSQSGEFGLVLFAYTYHAQLMSTDLYRQLLLVIVLSMLVTPPLAYLAREVLIRDDSDTARVEALLRRFHQEHYNDLDAADTQEASDREQGRD